MAHEDGPEMQARSIEQRPEIQAERVAGALLAVEPEPSGQTPTQMPQSHASNSMIPPFDDLRTPATHPPPASNNLLVYSRQRPRERAQPVAAPLEQDVTPADPNTAELPSQSCEEIGARQIVSANVSALAESVEPIRAEQTREFNQLAEAENLSSLSVEKDFLSKVKWQVSTLLPVPSFKKSGNMAAPTGFTPHRSRRVAKAGVEIQMGDMSRRSTKKAMRSLGVIGENDSIDKQAQEEYARLFSEPLSATHLAALTALFGWKSLEERSVDRAAMALVF
jgi:hypothetical protein